MICNICGENNAVINFQMKTESGNMTINLCEKCALENGVELGPDANTDLVKLIEKLKFFQNGITKKDMNIVCENCNTTLAEVKKNGTVGCPECYNAFKDYIAKFLSCKLDKNAYLFFEKEKEPIITKDSYLDFLRSQMKEAAAREDYEKAAIFRDRIKVIN